MKVELIKDVDRLGKKGDIVGVFPRVARELIKTKKAKDPNAPVKKETPKLEKPE
jgi:ribosomal protein L9